MPDGEPIEVEPADSLKGVIAQLQRGEVFRVPDELRPLVERAVQRRRAMDGEPIDLEAALRAARERVLCEFKDWYTVLWSDSAMTDDMLDQFQAGALAALDQYEALARAVGGISTCSWTTDTQTQYVPSCRKLGNKRWQWCHSCISEANAERLAREVLDAQLVVDSGNILCTCHSGKFSHKHAVGHPEYHHEPCLFRRKK